MVISPQDKQILLERLEKARLVKQAKAAEAKKAKEAPAPAPEPVPEPPAVVEEKHAPAGAPTPLEKPPATEPIDIPAPPDLVKASRKPAKKVCLPVDSDSEEEEVVMPKKTKGKAVRGTGKEVPYMKIKLYKEPSNPVAFQQMLESINDPQYEEEEEQAPPPPAPFVKGARVLQKVGTAPKRGVSSSLTPEDIKAAELRRLALEIFG
jgi:hypothetical protein